MPGTLTAPPTHCVPLLPSGSDGLTGSGRVRPGEKIVADKSERIQFLILPVAREAVVAMRCAEVLGSFVSFCLSPVRTAPTGKVAVAREAAFATRHAEVLEETS